MNWPYCSGLISPGHAGSVVTRKEGKPPKDVPRCTPLKVSYVSTAFTFQKDDATNVRGAFWLGRPRFLRDAAPHVYHHENQTMPDRGSLGNVIGVVDYGECVRPLSRPRYVPVAIEKGQRRFIHVWVKVGPASPQECWPDES